MGPAEVGHVCDRMDGANYPHMILEITSSGSRGERNNEHLNGSLLYGLGVSRFKLQPRHLPTLTLARLRVQKPSHWLCVQVTPNPCTCFPMESGGATRFLRPRPVKGLSERESKTLYTRNRLAKSTPSFSAKAADRSTSPRPHLNYLSTASIPQIKPQRPSPSPSSTPPNPPSFATQTPTPTSPSQSTPPRRSPKPSA